MLLEIGKARTSTLRRGASHQSPGLALNVPRGKGRRRYLPSSCAAELVRVWIDDALELLWRMPDSCSLDVADRGESTGREVAHHLGRSAEGVREARREAIERLAQQRGSSIDDGA
jgi:hypothetical protein